MNSPDDLKHPAQRPAEPDHPMMLDGGVIPGDTRFMVQCLFEEMLLSGIPPDDLLRMTRNSNYQALDAARSTLGNEELEGILRNVAARVGFLQVRIFERVPTCSGEADALKGDTDAQGS